MFTVTTCICQRKYKVLLDQNNTVLNENEVSPKEVALQRFSDSSTVKRVYSDCPNCGEENINLIKDPLL